MQPNIGSIRLNDKNYSYVDDIAILISDAKRQTVRQNLETETSTILDYRFTDRN